MKQDQQIRVRVTEPVRAALLQLAELQDVTISDVIREAIADYLDHLADADARKLEAAQ